MTTKLLPIKKDNNVIIYSLSFEEKKMKDYINYLSDLYSYNEKNIIVTSLCNNKVLSMGRFDLLKKYCKVDENYRLIKELDRIDSDIVKAKIEINVTYYSMLSKILEQAFLNQEPLINTTEIIKLTNHLLCLENNFKFSKLLDLNELNKAWDDPSRGFLSLDEYDKYVSYKIRSINNDDIKLNKFENLRIRNNIIEVIEKLQELFKIEQIGMFPIEENPTKLNELLTIFGMRNQEFEAFYGTLENAEVVIDGAVLLNNMEEEICSLYNIDAKEQNIKKKINHYMNQGINSFLHIKNPN